jgi:hypothetical protein
MIKIPNKIIDCVIDFIKENDLGPVELSGEQKRKYTELEGGRLDKILDICEKIIIDKSLLKNLNINIKESLEISEELSKSFSEKIIESFKNDGQKELGEIDEKEPEIYQPNIENKKSIFSAIIKEKK